MNSKEKRIHLIEECPNILQKSSTNLDRVFNKEKKTEKKSIKECQVTTG